MEGDHMDLSEIFIMVFIFVWIFGVLFWFPVILCVVSSVIVKVGINPDWDWARYVVFNTVIFIVGFVYALWNDFFGFRGPA